VTPALIAAFFWKRATPLGGTISVLSGTIVTISWKVAEKIGETVPLGLPAIYPAFISSVIALIVVSLSVQKPNEKKWKPFIGENEICT
jgi:SSS family solute:Na+ symporter/sodium/proline symporter